MPLLLVFVFQVATLGAWDYSEWTWDSGSRRVFEKLGEDVFLMDSRLPVAEVNESLRVSLPTTEFHTMGGLLLSRLRHIPREGEYVVEEGYRFTVVEANERAVLKLRVEPEYAVDNQS